MKIFKVIQIKICDSLYVLINKKCQFMYNNRNVFFIVKQKDYYISTSTLTLCLYITGYEGRGSISLEMMVKGWKG